MLRLNQLSKQFYTLIALYNLSFDIHQGEIVGILGPNGAGKTTLFKILAGLLEPTKGDISPLQEGWPTIGYKPERPFFPENLTITAYLKTCAGISNIPWQRQSGEVARVIELTGLQDVARNRISRCSKGMRQRISIAQSLIGDPQLLIFDEPSDGLDPIGQQEVQALMRQLRDQGKTILLSSHQLGEVTAVCTRLLILNKGQLVYHKEMRDALNERPQAIIRVDRNLSTIKALLTSLHSKITVDKDDHTLYIQEEALALRRDIMRLLLNADYDILQLAYQKSTLKDIYAEVVRS